MKIRVKLFSTFYRMIKNYSLDQWAESGLHGHAKGQYFLYFLQISASEGNTGVLECRVWKLVSIFFGGDVHVRLSRYVPLSPADDSEDCRNIADPVRINFEKYLNSVIHLTARQ